MRTTFTKITIKGTTCQIRPVTTFAQRTGVTKPPVHITRRTKDPTIPKRATKKMSKF